MSSVMLEYSNGTFSLLEGTKNFTFGNALTLTKGAADNGGDEGEDETEEAPADLTEEYLVGTWSGTESGSTWYPGDHTITITFNADGTATITHSYTDIEIYDFYIEGNVLTILSSAEMSSVMLEYSNGTFSLLEGTKNFTFGNALTLTKGAADNGGDEGDDGEGEEGGNDATYPSSPTYEYLAGTWYGVETGSADEGYEGEHTFVMVLDNTGHGTITHSTLGEINVSYIGLYETRIWIITNASSPFYLDYVDGAFVLSSGSVSLTYGDSLTLTKGEAPEGGDEPNPPAHEHNFVDGKCECGESDPNYQPPSTEEAPADLTEEYLVGTWSGSESGSTWYPGDYTITITFNADGSATMTHSYADIEIYDFYVEGNIVTILSSAEMSSVMLEYSNGTFSLLEGSKNFTFGNVLTLTKGAADNGGDEGADEPAAAPADLTEDYLIGTWNGVEVGGVWFSGEFTFTITFNADHTATMTHSEYGDVEIYDYYTEGNVLTIMCSAEMSTVMIEYSNGTFHVLDGAKNFTYGSELTMTKA